MKKPRKPKRPGKKHPAHHQHKHHHPAHLTPQQQAHARRARIRSLQRQLHNARHPAPAAKPGPAHKPRGLAIGEGWACCSAEALAASLRLAGWPVGDEDVLALHVAAGGSRDAGVPILAALEAAAEVGLAGVRPQWADVNLCVDAWVVPEYLGDQLSPVGRGIGALADVHEASVILGVELPGAHALAVDGPGVWSWGKWYPWSCFPDLVAEEAWTVRWPV